MKHLSQLVLFFTITLLASCVNRVAIPEEEDKLLFVELEMLRGSQELTATVMTSNNLQGYYPVERPEEVVMFLSAVGTEEIGGSFIYDADRDLYFYENSVADIIKTNYKLRLVASIEGTDIQSITAHTQVPKFNELNEETFEVVNEDKFTNELGEEYWESNIRFNFIDLHDNNSHFYQLILNEKLTEKVVENNEVKYSYSGDFVPFEIIDIVSGKEAIKQFYHKDGLFIDMDEMQSEFFEVRVRSTFPIENESQVTDFIFPHTLAITKEHYNYHLGLHNINEAKSSIFNEPALFRSNIDGGLGIFSSCNPESQIFQIVR